MVDDNAMLIAMLYRQRDEARAEVQQLTKERDQWRESFISLSQAAITLGLGFGEQPRRGRKDGDDGVGERANMTDTSGEVAKSPAWHLQQINELAFSLSRQLAEAQTKLEDSATAIAEWKDNYEDMCGRLAEAQAVIERMREQPAAMETNVGPRPDQMHTWFE